MQGPAPFPPPPPIPQPTQPHRPTRRVPLWAGILIGALSTIVLLVGGIVLAIYKFGWGAFTDQAVTAMNEQPIVQHCIGKIEKYSLDATLTGNDPRDDAFAFHVEGPSGKGVVTAVFTTVDDDHERIDEGKLTLEDGRTFELAAPGADDAAAGHDCSRT